VLAPYIEAHDRGPLFDLTVRSLGMYDDFVKAVAEDSGLPVEYRRCGSLEVAPDVLAAERLRALHQDHAADGTVEWLDGDAARELEPSLPDSIQGALFVPSHAYVSVPMLTEALSWAAVRHGVQIEAGRRVTGIRKDGKHLALRTDDGMEWRAERVVVAAGSWSGLIGLEEPAAHAVRPIRGQLLRLAWRGTPITRVLWGPDCYVVPWRDGTVLVGATAEDVGFDEHTTAAGIRDLLDAACELLPEAWRATFLEARVGLRPASTDGLPIIGASPSVEGAIYATGHFRNGILLAPLTAVLVGEIISGNSADPALQVVGPERFE
jgi:glycine oxidase